MSEPLFDHQNAAYAQLLYEEFSRNPDSVPQVWRAFFSQGPEVVREAGLLVPDTLAPVYAREERTPTGPPSSEDLEQDWTPVPAPHASFAGPLSAVLT